jgi:hypothetical protein
LKEEMEEFFEYCEKNYKKLLSYLDMMSESEENERPDILKKFTMGSKEQKDNVKILLELDTIISKTIAPGSYREASYWLEVINKLE